MTASKPGVYTVVFNAPIISSKITLVNPYLDIAYAVKSNNGSPDNTRSSGAIDGYSAVKGFYSAPSTFAFTITPIDQ